MDSDNNKSKRQYRNVCRCIRCNANFLFTEAMARKISFGLEDKVCPECGSSEITFVSFADSAVRGYMEKFKFPV